MLPINTNILTPNGWKKIKDIHINDIIFNKNGEHIKVINESQIQEEQIYEITFIDNIQFKCSKDHLLYITTYGSFFKDYQKLSINNILQNYTITDMQGIYQLAIPINEPINFMYYEKNNTISPYFFGILANSYIEEDNSVTFTNLNHIIIDKLNMSDIGKTTFIPYIYLYTIIENRLELLRGVIDSYGKIDKYGNIKLSIYKRQIYKDLSFVIHSLGYRFKLLSNINDIYNIIIYNDNNSLFTNDELLERFKNRVIITNDHVLKIKNIKEINEFVPMKNIIADSYICDNFIVT